MMRKFTIGLVGVLMLATALPSTVRATDLSGSEVTRLLKIIAELRAEVLRLQVLLGAQATTSDQLAYQARLFTKPVEAQYFVVDGILKPPAGRVVRTNDQVLFDIFVETIGKEAVKKRVTEWRVFADTRGEVDAYVEQIIGTETYVVNLNRVGFEPETETDRRALQELFLHEYAHMLLLTNKAQSTEYQKQFWKRTDMQKASTLKAEEFEYHYATVADRFVSTYALRSVDEDMAEMFLYAVLDPQAVSTGQLKSKYNFLLAIPEVGAEIHRLQDRLN